MPWLASNGPTQFWMNETTPRQRGLLARSSHVDFIVSPGTPCRRTTAFTCRAGCNDAVSRKTRMPARSSATLCSAGLPIAIGPNVHATAGQRCVHTVHVGESLPRILGQAAEDNGLKVGRGVGAASQQAFRFLVQMRREHLHARAAGERRLPGEEEVRERAQTVDVAAGVHLLLAARLLRRKIRRRASD